MDTSSAEFIAVTYSEDEDYGTRIQRYLTPKKYLDIICRIKRLIYYHHDWYNVNWYKISYSSSVTIHSEHDRAIANAIGEIDGEIIEESDIPSNRILTEFIIDHVLSSTDDQFSNLKKRIEASAPKTLLFFTEEEFETFLNCSFENSDLDDYIREKFCEKP